MQLTSNVLLPSSSPTFLPFFLLCFRRIEDGRIRDSLGYRFTVINVDGGVEFARYPPAWAGLISGLFLRENGLDEGMCSIRGLTLTDGNGWEV